MIDCILVAAENRNAEFALIDLENRLRVPEIINRPSIQTLMVHHGVGGAMMAKTIHCQIFRIVRSLNISNQLNDIQIKTIVHNFMNNYRHESIEDICLCFKMGREGRFGRIYNRIDEAIINEWMESYLDIKAMERAAQEQSGPQLSQETGPMKPKEREDFYSQGKAFLNRRNEIDRENRIRKKLGFMDPTYLKMLDKYQSDARRKEAAGKGSGDNKDLPEPEDLRENEDSPIPESGGGREPGSVPGTGSKPDKKNNDAG